LSFGKGQTLTLRGTADNANSRALADYNDAMRSYTVGGQRLFKSVSPPTSSSGTSGTLTWDFTCELNRQEVQ
jgi:hypothetical protein